MSAKRAWLGIDVIRALIVRCAFLVHMLFSIWAASCVTGKDEVWIIAILAGLLFIEAVYNIVRRKGQELKWFSPCIFVFLLAVVPPIWILNLDMIRCMSTQNVNQTTCSGLRGQSYVCSLVSVDNIFDRKPMVYTIEEIMLLLLIVGKWLLPKGSVSMNEHNQLLFIYFGLSFDILDLFGLFDEPAVLANPDMKFVILVIYTISLFQFTIVFTVVKRKKPKLNPDDEEHPLRSALNKCCMSELWSLSSHIAMHDGPYLILRLYCLIGLKVFSYNLIFFTIKNGLMVALQIYRYFVLCLQCKEEIGDEQTIDASVTSIPRQFSDPSYQRNNSVNSINSTYKPQQYKPEFNRSKQSLNSTGMSSQDFNFVSTV